MELTGEQVELLLGEITELQAVKAEMNIITKEAKKRTDAVKLQLEEFGLEHGEVIEIGDLDVSTTLYGGGEKINTKEVTVAKVRTYFPKGILDDAIKETEPSIRLNVKKHKDE
tara:strand:- start:580 stop:918 length:339 start_codon:yes stop_codon:yes gene_type:complete